MQLKKKKKKITVKTLTYCALSIFMASIMVFAGAQLAIPSQVRAEEIVCEATPSGVTFDADTEYTAKLLGFIPTKTVRAGVSENLTLIPGGDVFGVKFFTKGVLVIGICDIETEEGVISPATKAGLKKGDVICEIDGKEVNTSEEITRAIQKCEGKPLELSFIREDKSYRATLEPKLALSDGKYKTGMWVRDSTAGIGTVTFYNPEDMSFAGLGHGICDADTGTLMPILKGAVVDVALNDVIRGRSGHPGELKGSFGTEKRGSVTSNTGSGISGYLNEMPEREALKVAMRSEVKNGPAHIFCDVTGQGRTEYEIEILKIYSGNEPTKNFVIKVTDPTLLEITGGIVQGMSGSPIVQNGKLVGAVTHVLVNDPARGYGIFIENMFSENMLSETEQIK